MKKTSYKLFKKIVASAATLTILLIISSLAMSCDGKQIISDDSWKDIKETDVVLGNPNAEVLVIEYFDLSCPACAVAHKSIVDVWRLVRDDITLVVRHFPLTQIHPNAYLAGQYLEAARDQNAFFALQTKLYENQSDWSNVKDPEEYFLQYAAEINLDKDKITASLEVAKKNSRINDDLASGEAAGVTGTPTFFINGEKTPFPQTGESFYKMIQEAKQRLVDDK